MSLVTAAFILVVAFITSAVSGVFGMAGGLMLMGALAIVLPVSAAFVAHGLIQLTANGWRAVLHRKHVQWKIVGLYAIASFVAGLLVSTLSFTPSKPFLFLALGLVPGILWLPKAWIRLDAAKPFHALTSGFLVTALNLLAGVAGPLLDIFFVRTALNRHQIVATKAATQVFAHLAKIVVYGAPLIAAKGLPASFYWVIVAAVPLSMLGTVVGGRILDRMSDKGFLTWTRYIVTGIGVVYLIQFLGLVLKE
ncbi:putative membrane protein YfcA [Caulobacter ginsengisoli]|uniref:Probable membrane transporter protein n=1 Tax=Caulobacter ginsengisoli TaxID=400775 RepID=A0ABU0IXI4_9CAUL|nr:sulfite exporter TauE/SafE family protein [Caulobacter ginsengisoli]MDQ0466731.1 putative membrane protein YfcA [Caulobacter ginsengisoli]